jgi:hypothetical protein
MAGEFWVSVASVAVSAGIGSYLTGRFLEKGRIAAMRACFQDVLEQAEGRARAEERGKRLATHEDIENVLRELRLVTMETEQIKVDISGNAEARRRVWQERRDLYARIMRWGNEHIRLVNAVKFAIDSPDAWEQVVRSHLIPLDHHVDIVIFGTAEMRLAYEHFGKNDFPLADTRTLAGCDAEIQRVMSLTAALGVLARRELVGEEQA